MKTPNLAGLVKSVRAVATKHSPEILTGLGIAGMITTTVLAVQATPKAIRLIEEFKEEVYIEDEKIRPIDAIKVAWKPYIPAAVTGIASVACLIGASSVSTRRNAALATAYKLSETAFSEYRDKVVETIGEKKENAVKDKIAEDVVKKKPVEKSEVIITEKGKTLFFDYMSGRYFESDIDTVKKAENLINKQMLHDTFGYASLNDFYDELGLEHIGTGNDIGWNVHNLVDLYFSSQISSDGRPAIVISHNNRPNYGFDSVM